MIESENSSAKWELLCGNSHYYHLGLAAPVRCINGSRKEKKSISRDQTVTTALCFVVLLVHSKKMSVLCLTLWALLLPHKIHSMSLRRNEKKSWLCQKTFSETSVNVIAQQDLHYHLLICLNVTQLGEKQIPLLNTHWTFIEANVFWQYCSSSPPVIENLTYRIIGEY